MTSKNQSSFKDLKYDFKASLPALILGVKADPYSKHWTPYKFKGSNEFLNISHQCGGSSCNQLYLQGMVLEPRRNLRIGIEIMEQTWLNSQLTRYCTPLNKILQYRDFIKTYFGVDCNNSYVDFQEGVYPIDIEFLSKLTSQKLPKDLNQLIEFKSELHIWMGSIRRWNLWILGSNSD